MHFINRDLFGYIIENKGETDQISLFAIANRRRFEDSDKYRKFMDRVKNVSNSFINMRFNVNDGALIDHSDVPVYAYKHTVKGKEVCWTTTGSGHGPWDECRGKIDTYFIAIPYKQTIASITCSEGVEVMKVTSRSYSKIYGSRGTFDWRDETRKYPKDSTEGKNYNKALYLIVNVTRGAEDPHIEIDEVKIPRYTIQKAIENNSSPDTILKISHNTITVNLPENQESDNSYVNFYPSGKIKNYDYTLEKAKQLEDIVKVNIMDLIKHSDKL